MNPRTT